MAKPRKSTTNYVPAPAGIHAARCIQVIDLGTQSDGNVRFKPKPKLLIVFELVNTNHVFDDKIGPQPFVVSERYTNSTHRDSNLRKAIDSMFGKVHSDEEFENLDLSSIVNKRVTLNIIHAPSKADPKRVFARVASIMPADPSKQYPAARNPLISFAIGDKCLYKEGTGRVTELTWQQCFEKLLKWHQEIISASPEYKELAGNVTPREQSPDDIHEESEDVF